MNNGKTKKRKKSTFSSRSSSRRKSTQKQRIEQPVEEKKRAEKQSLVGKLAGMTEGAFRLLAKTTETSFRMGMALFLTPERQRMVEEAGRSLRDIRLLAGLTLNELSDSLDLKDKSLLEAVENGTATLSFELILRLSSLLARHDPVPFIMKYTRTYDPDVWQFLEEWGMGRLPLQYERERKFINIYRRNDEVRKLSDEDFEKLLEFVQAAFDMAYHFIEEQEVEGA